MLHPIRPAGASVPASRPESPKVPSPGFARRLEEGVRDPSSPSAADPTLVQIQRFASQAIGTEAWEARLLESYDILSADEGLYEVQTSRGPYQVIRSRMGELSIFAAP